MKKILTLAILAAIACGCLTSCNEKPKSYKFVIVGQDGKEKVEEISAKNDTDALNMYMDRMEKVIVANLGKANAEEFEAMYVISPDGDTLNTNEELLNAVSKGLPTMVELPAEAPKTEAEGQAK